MKIYTLWVSDNNFQEGSWWMVAAEDEYSWEGDPDRCDAIWKRNHEEAHGKNYDVREATIEVDMYPVFTTPEADGKVI